MPRVSIYESARTPDSRQATRVSVGWHREGSVQLATTRLADGADPGDEWLDAQDGAEPQPAWQGSWLDLDRSQINQLITLLRKARDQAYGKDV
jgi:hypothetical protein